jgi:hypothetical protein
VGCRSRRRYRRTPVLENRGEQPVLQDRARGGTPEEPKWISAAGTTSTTLAALSSAVAGQAARRGRTYLQPASAVCYGLLARDECFHEVLRGLGVLLSPRLTEGLISPFARDRVFVLAQGRGALTRLAL